MTRRCFLIDQQDPDTGSISLSDEVAHHVRKVLRLRPGDTIELRDGRGNGWDAVLTDMTGREITAAVGKRKLTRNESPLRLTLALAFSRADRMELALRQATEMGVFRFVAFPAERSGYRLPGTQMANRKERWRRITREALCQCGRMILPEIHILSDIEEVISPLFGGQAGEGRVLKALAREEGDRGSLLALCERYPEYRQMLVVVGPEGGWTQREGEQFLEAGFHPVHLGPRTLRLETATVALVAAVQLLWGDLGTRRA